ncbi:bifunctional tetrahydrofolate synthase/dihydrofolate synthase [Shewanella psychrotolerans]|uniref:bifunctional tetrahydrofolate synthase/dihydrofolate synthase n=1 Tax=Shewanella psychrotolerans TaxID=2864206 RepID=UPI001C661549|nr:bifunctional tetrahydrofolate synthase/dihydrofolate synthase [Shewanella psychrotolerans]QYK02862.1 bifunctional tetrahydrofolate synthase/dihydrofolate synthase [Shewanella psychrotolerans]
MQTVPNHHSSLTTWLDHLMSIHPTEIDMGLSRVSSVAKTMGLTDLGQTKVITVGGTNGKGTTCAMIEQIMTQAGYKVGVYSSPHMLKYNERVRVAGIDASDQELIEAFCAIDKARGEISLTFFEYATLAGLVIFKQAALDLVLLEVGLGGRLDATNIIDADISVVTSVDIDHQEYLGDTRELVGREKAGIFRAGCPAIVGERDLPVSVAEAAHEIGAQLLAVGDAFDYIQHDDSWDFNGMSLSLSGIPIPQLPLPNAATALAVIEQLIPSISEDVIYQGLLNAKLTGRLELFSKAPVVLLDVAHNPHAARYLKQRLAAYSGHRVVALCGMLKDKDCQAVISTLDDVVDTWYFTGLNCERSASADLLVSCLPQGSIGYPFESIVQAYQALTNNICDDDVVIVFGSFYTVAEFKNLNLG